MPAGLQVWRQDGSLVFDTNDSLSRHIGSAFTGGTSSGSIFVAEWNAGLRPWFYSLQPNGAGVFVPLFIRVEGANLVWSVVANPDNGPVADTLLIWGVY